MCCARLFTACLCMAWALLMGVYVWHSQGVYVAYVIVAWCYIGVSVAGYWAFGINVAGNKGHHSVLVCCALCKYSHEPMCESPRAE